MSLLQMPIRVPSNRQHYFSQVTYSTKIENFEFSYSLLPCVFVFLFYRFLVEVMKSSPHDGMGGSREGWLPWDCLEQMPETSDLNTAVWYHGKITRNQAQSLLDSGIHGSFLIRESESIPGSWSISLRDRDTVYHYRIMRVDSLFHISPNHRFHSLTELVQHHAEHPDGLITTLRFPVSNQQGRVKNNVTKNRT